MKEPTHILAVMGEGGHSKECLQLIDLLGTEKYCYSYVLVKEDEVTESKIRVPGRIYRIARPSCIKSNKIKDLVRFPLCSVQTIMALIRIRPDAVITTGPSVAILVCFVAKLMGARILFVETGSRIHKLSTTGKLMRRMADLYFVQWEELLPAAPGAIFAGRLF